MGGNEMANDGMILGNFGFDDFWHAFWYSLPLKNRLITRNEQQDLFGHHFQKSKLLMVAPYLNDEPACI